MATDGGIRRTISDLVAQERELREQLAQGEITGGEEHERLRAIEVELDQCWDSSRQRGAAREPRYGGELPGSIADGDVRLPFRPQKENPMTTSSEQAAHSPLPTGTEGRDIPGHAGAVARFVVAFASFVGGLVLMGSGMSGVDGGVWLFVGGLAAATLAFALPMAGTGTTER
ncbi:hypothetical protein OY671_000819 [Metschnikowia pulcherrima]|nr:hypothetical protein OY671_000819 [Metschnikowia pulcherrima]